MAPMQLQINSSGELFKPLSNDEIGNLHSSLKTAFEEYGLETHPFKIKWYNDIVGPEYALKYPDDTLAFLVISSPSMFERAFLPYLNFVVDKSLLKENSGFDPLDKCMQHYFNLLKKQTETSFDTQIDVIHDFELSMPFRKPRILLQTAAHVSGAAFYYKQRDNGRHRMGVCIHPRYGGWFGIRGVFIFGQLTAPNFPLRMPPNVVAEDEVDNLLELFNDHWTDYRYRDIIPVECKYSSLQREYFALVPKKRMEFIRSRLLTLNPD